MIFFLKKAFMYAMVLMASTLLISCNKNKNLVGKWEMVRYFINGTPEVDANETILILYNSGKFDQSIHYRSGQIDKKSGNWDYNSKQSRIVFHYYGNTKTVIWDIAYFENDSISLRHKIPGFFVERSFVRK